MTFLFMFLSSEMRRMQDDLYQALGGSVQCLPIPYAESGCELDQKAIPVHGKMSVRFITTVVALEISGFCHAESTGVPCVGRVHVCDVMSIKGNKKEVNKLPVCVV
jgi:hypothetical protein